MMDERRANNPISRRLLLSALGCAFLFSGQAWSGAKVPRNHGRVSATPVEYAGSEPVGTVIINSRERQLFIIEPGQKARRYAISVGRDGFRWNGTVRVGAKQEWPSWTPPAEMLARDPSLPESVPPGPFNPLGARAIYLYRGGADTLYRIHGTNDAQGIGGFQTSGCFRLTNADVMDVYQRIKIGAKVIVIE